MELGFWVPIVSGITDSLSCISNSKAQDSGFYKQNAPGFRNPLHGTSRMTETTSQCLILSKIDYSDIVSDPIPDYLVKRLQRVQLAVASFDLGRCM